MPDTFEWKIKKKMNERFARYIDPKRTDSENRFDDVSLIFFFFSFQADAMEFKDDVDDIYTRQLRAKL